ncbi:hypothetical protein [Ornithinicoccus hortensis]|uniref:Uncharacterized protein n=1 Tax=Ornithinicoccus hortensis TaxID=82346 RepID=A0A542YLU0_9MICO|nr:hypothetical protein [Ornithinicoccus hortensis]TQL49048.1 hypothetical protein FB467_0113 [Ornithinicoccus hortensis]
MDPDVIIAISVLVLVTITGVGIAVFVLRRSCRPVADPMPVVVQRDGERVVEIPTRQVSRTSRGMPFLALGQYTGTGLLRIAPGRVEVSGLRERTVPFDQIAGVDIAARRTDYVALALHQGRGYGFITASPQGTDAVLLELAPHLPLGDLARERLAWLHRGGGHHDG